MQTQPFSYQQIVNSAQLTALNSPTPPTAGSQQYLIFVQYIALAIADWEGVRNVIWNELYVDQPNFSVLAVGTTSISLPPDFKFLYGGFVRITYPNGTVLPVPVKRLPEQTLNPYNVKKEFYVTGNIQSGFQLILGWPIQTGAAEIGATVSFRYYAYASVPQLTSGGIMVNPTDVPQMSDPSYVYKSVTAMVAAANYNLNLYTIYSGKATTSLTNMIQANEMGTDYQDDYVKDVDALLGSGMQVTDRFNSTWWTGPGGNGG
jgi:hypothetical protein